jgi:hypothetical protein
MICLRWFTGWILVSSILCGASVLAADGTLEINQACAENGGCFTGDSAGFPVTIASPGSYRLTGNLTLSADVDAVLITTSSVTLDMGGFVISGPGSCTGSGSSIDCGEAGVGSGVWVDANPNSITIRNGVISNMRLTGIRAEGNGHLFEELKLRHNHSFGLVADERMIVKNCTAIQNGGAGIKLNDGSIVQDSVAMGNGSHGIHLVNEGSTVFGNTSQGNGEFGFLLDEKSRFGANNVSSNNTLGDSCGGGICVEGRRYYLSKTTHEGDETIEACVDGFHFASFFEIRDTTELVYDTKLGLSEDDSGAGPPDQFLGFIRSGGPSDCSDTCCGWTSNSPSDSGGVVSLRSSLSWSQPAQFMDPYELDDVTCGTALPVWCVED